MKKLRKICEEEGIPHYEEDVEKAVCFNLKLLQIQGIVEKVYDFDNNEIKWQLTEYGRRILEKWNH